MSKWFGKNWGAPACDPADHVDTPVNKICIQCHRAILDGDQGILMPGMRIEDGRCMEELVAMHLDCFLHHIGQLPCSPKYHPEEPS